MPISKAVSASCGQLNRRADRDGDPAESLPDAVGGRVLVGGRRFTTVAFNGLGCYYKEGCGKCAVPILPPGPLNSLSQNGCRRPTCSVSTALAATDAVTYAVLTWCRPKLWAVSKRGVSKRGPSCGFAKMTLARTACRVQTELLRIPGETARLCRLRIMLSSRSKIHG